MEAQLVEMLNFLVKQQFIREGDIVTDRMKTKEVHIRGSGRAIKDFIRLLNDNISLVVEEKYENYLDTLCGICDLDIQRVMEAFSARLPVLEEHDRTPPLMLSMLMAEFLGKIRERAFEETLEEIKRRTRWDLKISEGDEEFEQRFDDIIKDFFQRNEPNLSLLYNLCFLDFIAMIIHSNKVRRTVKIILGLYMNKVVEKVSEVW